MVHRGSERKTSRLTKTRLHLPLGQGKGALISEGQGAQPLTLLPKLSRGVYPQVPKGLFHSHTPWTVNIMGGGQRVLHYPAVKQLVFTRAPPDSTTVPNRRERMGWGGSGDSHLRFRPLPSAPPISWSQLWFRPNCLGLGASSRCCSAQG